MYLTGQFPDQAYTGGSDYYLYDIIISHSKVFNFKYSRSRLPHISCVNLGKILNLSVLYFLSM